jgi:hypothetical protein
LAATGAESRLTSDNSVQATIGSSAVIALSSLLDVTSKLTQDADASADSYSFALASGSGAGAKNTFTSRADIGIGTNAVVDAASISLAASNTFKKDHYKDSSSLRSGSAAGGSLTILESRTDVGTADHPFQATVDVKTGARLTAYGNGASAGLFRIETLTDATAVDNVRIEAFGGYAIAVGLSRLDSTANSAMARARAGAGVRVRRGGNAPWLAERRL